MSENAPSAVTGPGLTAGNVALRLGVAVTTLRSWHQRYGLGPSQHLPPTHRRYSEQDLARLETMRQLTTRGVPAAKAARIALAPRRTDSPADDTTPALDAGSSSRGLMRAATRLDVAMMAEILARAISTYGVLDTWDLLIRPALSAIGRRHDPTGLHIDVEHLLSRCISQALTEVTRTCTVPVPPRTLLACADEEQHTLPLEALAALLATRQVGTRMLGPRVPPQALVAVVRRTGPTVVALWSQTPATADPRQLTALLAARPAPALILAAGPGWNPATVPHDIAQPADLAQATDLTRALVGATS